MGALVSSTSSSPPSPPLDRLGKVDRRVREFLQHRVGAFADGLPVVAIDRLEDAFPGGQGDIDVAVEDEPQLLQGVDFQRIADDDRQPAIPLRKGDYRVLPDHGLGNQLDHRGRDRHLVEVDVVQAVLFRHRPHHLFAGGVSQPDQGIGQLDPRFLGHLSGFGQLVRTDDLLADEDFGVIALLSCGHARLHVARQDGLPQYPKLTTAAALVNQNSPKNGRGRGKPGTPVPSGRPVACVPHGRLLL